MHTKRNSPEIAPDTTRHNPVFPGSFRHMDTHTETTVFQETKGSFAFVSKENAWHPQRDLNPCRHLERVVS